MSTTATNLTPVLVSKPYAASRSSTACRSPKSPLSSVLEATAWRARDSKMSSVLDSSRLNWSGVRRGAGRPVCASVVVGRIVVWRGLFC